jgi:hypothetical protein
MSEMLLVSKTQNERLFFIIDPKDSQKDGVVVRNGESFLVSFWSFASRAPLQPILATTFHKDLWKNYKNEDWQEKYLTREIDLTETKEFESISKMLEKVPTSLQGYS